jgi:hypothetical protein
MAVLEGAGQLEPWPGALVEGVNRSSPAFPKHYQDGRMVGWSDGSDAHRRILKRKGRCPTVERDGSVKSKQEGLGEVCNCYSWLAQPVCCIVGRLMPAVVETWSLSVTALELRRESFCPFAVAERRRQFRHGTACTVWTVDPSLLLRGEHIWFLSDHPSHL